MKKLSCFVAIITFLYSHLVEAQRLPFADLHTHSALKATNTNDTQLQYFWERKYNDCSEKLKKIFVKGSIDIPKSSQSNIDALFAGNVRLACISISPIENGFYNPNFVGNKKEIGTFSCIAGVDSDETFFHKKLNDYYSNFLSEYEFIKLNANKPYRNNNEKYIIAKNADDINKTLHNKNILTFVLSIEGAHILGTEMLDNIDKIKRKSLEKTIENTLFHRVQILKGVRPYNSNGDYITEPILFISVAHHFDNHLAGHAPSMFGVNKLVFNQRNGMNEGMSTLGINIIKQLINKNEGRRILIDVKHMSSESRKWYFHFTDSLKTNGDTIPIVASHTGISGIETSDELFDDKDNKKKLKNSYLDTWSLNIANDEVKKIVESKGIIGLILDEQKLSGLKSKKLLKTIVPGSNEAKKLFIKIIMANIFTAVKAGGSSTWNCLAIGSDFDGGTNPIDFYATSAEMPLLYNDLKNFFENPEPIFDMFSKEEIIKLMSNYTGKQLSEKVMSTNAIEFIKRNL